MVIDPSAFAWNDLNWAGLDPARQVVYELHVGTFTEAGTYEAAAVHLESLCELGVTCIEMMPVNEFVGRFGWGYDGVNWFAPFHHYGEPDALRAFINRAHELGLGVILDVVYNHFGNNGNFLPRFGAQYLTEEVTNPWGGTPNYGCHAMRRMAIDNAAYWIREFHFDGLRLDAIQSIHDSDSPALLTAMVREARAAAGARRIVISAEDYWQRTSLLTSPSAGGAAIDHLWNEDFHHSCRVALTGNHYGFFKSYRGTAQELLSSLRRGFLFQGQYDDWCKTERGSPVTDEALTSFVVFTQNHDAVANTLNGRRLQTLVSPGKYRAITAALLLGPQTPLIFMGQEFNSSAPFPYFADYPAETRQLWEGRKQEAGQFTQFQDPAALAQIANPCSIETARAATLNHSERERNLETYRLFVDLIALRKRFFASPERTDVDGALLTYEAFVLRWFDEDGKDRLLLLNFGPQIELRAWPEPLLAPPRQHRWHTVWSSESPRYGGMGAVDAWQPVGWQLAAAAAQLLIATYGA
jgi:maltooligosyltrehalose trehalohydrolase